MWARREGENRGLWAPQRQVGLGMEILKGLGESRGAGLSLESFFPVPPPGKGSPRCSGGGPLAPREPRLVFQSRRAGIFSVQQISLMAQRWSRGTLARWQPRGGGCPRGHSLGRRRPQSSAPGAAGKKLLRWNGRENYVELEIRS